MMFVPDVNGLDQHLLVSKEIIDFVVNTGEIDASETVLEIGPGLGALTVPLASKAGKIIAVELDGQFRAHLDKLVKRLGNVDLIWGNILNVELPKFDKLVANTPFSIIEPLIERLKALDFKKAILITGAKFAQIATAQHGTESFGKLSLLTQCYFQVEMLRLVDQKSFSPRPRVKSAIIALTPLNKEQLISVPEMYVMREIFEQRDKLVKNALREGLIRWAHTKGARMTKRQTRVVIANLSTNENILNSKMENLNNQQINTLYGGIRSWTCAHPLQK